MGEWGMGECECGRSHPERAEGARVIPSERSDSRDLHLASALFNGRNAEFPRMHRTKPDQLPVGREISPTDHKMIVKSWMETLDAPVRGARPGEELIRHLPVHPALSEALPFKKASRKIRPFPRHRHSRSAFHR